MSPHLYLIQSPSFHLVHQSFFLDLSPRSFFCVCVSVSQPCLEILVLFGCMPNQLEFFIYCYRIQLSVPMAQKANIATSLGRCLSVPVLSPSQWSLTTIRNPCAFKRTHQCLKIAGRCLSVPVLIRQWIA